MGLADSVKDGLKPYILVPRILGCPLKVSYPLPFVLLLIKQIRLTETLNAPTLLVEWECYNQNKLTHLKTTTVIQNITYI